MSSEKKRINVVVIGHVDNGKSTLIGRILEATGEIPAHLIEKYKKEAEAIGKGSFAYAWVMDKLPEERERGLTIDLAHNQFSTKNYRVTIIDAPGHKDFVKNMITGTSQADMAILVVDSSKGPQPQMKEHVILAKGLGVSSLVVAMNKMDILGYDQTKFDAVKAKVLEELKGVGISERNTQFVPVSAYDMENLHIKSERLGWYKGGCLLDEIDRYVMSTAEDPTLQPFRMPIQDVYTITGIGTVAVGRIETGRCRAKMKVWCSPAGKEGEIKSVEAHHIELKEGLPGDNVGVNIAGIPKNELTRGSVLGTPESKPRVAKKFIAEIAVLNLPGVIVPGYSPVFHCHTAQVSCTFTKLIRTFNNKKETLVENPSVLRKGDLAEVELQPLTAFVIEDDFRQLSRFAIRDRGETIGAGRCIKTITKDELSK